MEVRKSAVGENKRSKGVNNINNKSFIQTITSNTEIKNYAHEHNNTMFRWKPNARVNHDNLMLFI